MAEELLWRNGGATVEMGKMLQSGERRVTDGGLVGGEVTDRLIRGRGKDQRSGSTDGGVNSQMG